MLRQGTHEFTVSTRGRGFYEITREVAAWVKQGKITSGLLTLHVRHTSASLLIQENADPEVRRDLERFFRGSFPMATRSFNTPRKATTTCRRMCEAR